MKKLALRLMLSYWELPLAVRRAFLPLLRLLARPSVFTDLADIDEECRHHNTQPTAALRRDITNAWILFGSTPKEFFLYSFADKTDRQRDEFITDHHRIQLLKREIGIRYFRDELINKYGFYLRSKEFFGRECMSITASTTFDEFRAFVERAGGKVFAKENRGSFGSDGRVISLTSEEALRADFDKLLAAKHDWIAEGFIVQDKRLSCWNEGSVNTIRISSFLTPDGVQILGPFIRTGRVGACVDNADSGGIFAVIDEKSGKIITDGADKFGHVFTKHPDSLITYKGWQVPEWEKLLSIAKAAHQKLPEHKYIGFDFALSTKGWVMVEGNWGQFIAQQISTRKGYKKAFCRLLCS